MPTGTIARLLIDKGFGFIRDESGMEHFFHRSAVRGAVFELLREGQRVEFTPEESGEGPARGRRPADRELNPRLATPGPGTLARRSMRSTAVPSASSSQSVRPLQSSHLIGSERGPVALPVFKIGCSPLARGGWVRLPGASANRLACASTRELPSSEPSAVRPAQAQAASVANESVAHFAGRAG